MFNNKMNGPNSLTAQGQGAGVWDRTMKTATEMLPYTWNNETKSLDKSVDDYDLAALADAEADGAVAANLGTGAEAIASEGVAADASLNRELKTMEEGPSEFQKRFGSALKDLGKETAAQSAAPKIEAKPFKPKFTGGKQQQTYAQTAIADMDTSGMLNLNPYGF